ncbi:unnamed protein product [Gongylonema pulchrum]|uniref:tRNA_edit domain-containing protein n=1 Tax=Gongylonema pulchrum TaxID=637853 RepID=A0A183D8R5_9BILA|nr:unnamed protein product [Gongylonema pulchrum]
MATVEVGKARLRKASSSCTVGSRRQSLTAQLTRSARRFSAAVAPQLTKLDFLPVLQSHHCLVIRIADVTQAKACSETTNLLQLQTAIKQYIVKNNVQFSPIDFEITDVNDARILNVSLHPDEMVLAEGARRIFSITFDESDPEEYGTVIAKIRHPISGK